MSRSRSRIPLALLALVLGPAPGCGGPEVDVPEALLGVWESDHPDYAGRQMELFDDAVIFRSDERRYTVHALRRFSREGGAEGGPTRYLLGYAEGGSTIEVGIEVDAAGTLVFEHRRGVRWRRAKAADE